MKKILVTYTTNAGSTEEVAQVVAEELRKAEEQRQAAGHSGGVVKIDLRRMEEVACVGEYDTVIIGAPMILGWSRAAQRFVRRHQNGLANKRVAYFCTLMNLTDTHQDAVDGIPVCIDPQLPCPPKNPARLGIKEAYATLNNYLRPVLKAAPAVKPVSVAMFGGKLELFRLKWWQMLFVMVIIQARPGDLRNWDYIRSWAAGLMVQ